MKNLIRIGIVGLVLLASLLPCLTISGTASATGPDFGLWSFLNTSADSTQNISCVNWFDNSNFDWLIEPYGSSPIDFHTPLADILHTAGKDVILRTWWWDDTNFSVGNKSWTDLYNSMIGSHTLYNQAVSDVVTEINDNGVSNLYAITLGEEEPLAGYWGNVSAINISKFVAVHNQMYSDIKVLYPTLRIFANVDIIYLTDGEMATLHYDGLINGYYSAPYLMKAWLSRMVALGGAETYCIIYGTSNLYTDMLPSFVGVTYQMALSAGVPHLGWWAYNGSASPSKEILFNNWSSCSNPEDVNCSANYKNEILGILDGTVFDGQVGNSSDDAWAYGDDSSFTSTDTDYYVHSDDTVSSAKGAGFRFQNVSIPLSANITTSYIATTAYAGQKMYGNISAHKTSSSPNFVTSPYVYNATSRARTTAEVFWNVTFPAVSYTWTVSPSILPVIQEMSNLSRPQVFPLTMFVLGRTDIYNGSDFDGISDDTVPVGGLGMLLHIEYQTSPVAQTKPATVINGTAATLNGRVYSDGGIASQGRFFYGTSATYSGNSSLAGSMNMADTFTYTLGSLNKGQHYHFMASLNNSLGMGNGSDATFITYPDEPNTVTVVAINSTALTVSFVKGTGAVSTGITRKAGSYPANPADGTIAYLGAGATFDDTGLTASTAYYYRGWSLASDGGLTATSLTYGQGFGTTDATPAPPASIGGTMGTIVVIVLSMLIILMLLGYSISEYNRNGFNENTKVAIAGIITIIMAESILIAFF